MGGVRVDKYLWGIRMYKTRSLATKMCRQNKVKIGGELVKPAKEVGQGDVVSAKKHGVWFSFKVLQPLSKRVGAKFVEDYARDVTSGEELEKLEVLRARFKQERAKGMGRPTKKDRRDLEDFMYYMEEGES